MARKPRSQWSPAYRRRIERAEARGLSRQAARGHAPREHVSRKQAAGLTAGQSSAIGRFARSQAGRGGGDPDAAAVALKQWVRVHGYERFEELRALVNARREVKRRSVMRTRTGHVVAHISIGIYDLNADFDEFGLPLMPGGNDLAWFFYH